MPLSPGSILFSTEGHLRLQLEVGGERRYGRLVRCGPGEDGRLKYVVQLEDALHEPDAGPWS